MMINSKKYENANAFRRALEDRLKNIAREQATPLDRLRRRITFDRFLARLFDRRNQKPRWLLKGGYALEFRFHNIARTTKDVDFSIPGIKNADEHTIRAILQDEVLNILPSGCSKFYSIIKQHAPVNNSFNRCPGNQGVVNYFMMQKPEL